MQGDDEIVASLAEFLRGRSVTTEDAWWFMPLEEKFGAEVVQAALSRSRELSCLDSGAHTCSLWLRSAGRNRGRAIKALQLFTALSSSEVSRMVEKAPVRLKSVDSRQQAQSLVRVFQSLGIELFVRV